MAAARTLLSSLSAKGAPLQPRFPFSVPSRLSAARSVDVVRRRYGDTVPMPDDSRRAKQCRKPAQSERYAGGGALDYPAHKQSTNRRTAEECHLVERHDPPLHGRVGGLLQHDGID